MPEGSLQNADSACVLIQDMEKDATDNRDQIQTSMQGTQRDVLAGGKQGVAGVSHLDPSRGTLVNTGLVLKCEAGEIIEQLSENPPNTTLAKAIKKCDNNFESVT
ncbi:MAG: hypothetical protein LBJ89_01900 [Holosporales bacterium]|nr:hypothetical protein [Holosporales bacterium]